MAVTEMDIIQAQLEAAAAEAGAYDEHEVYRFVVGLYNLAKRSKDSVRDNVERYYKLWRGEHWSSMRPKYKTSASSNFIFAIIETQVTWLSENKPNLIVNPMGPEDTTAANVVERIIREYLWDRLDMRRKIKQAMRSALVRGRGFLKVTWDPLESPEWGGDVAVDYVPWREIYVDPHATDIEDARFILQVRDMPKSEVVRKWPEQGWRVQASGSTDDMGGAAYSSEVDRPVISTSSGAAGGSDTVRVIEAWIRDDSTELREEVGADGEPMAVEVPVYPGGRVIIVAEGGVVLADMPNPYVDGEFPFASVVAYEDDESVWGLSEVAQLEPIQRTINLLESRFADHIRLMANAIWIKDRNSGVKAEQLTNQEGLVVTKNPGTEVRRESPPPLPAHLFNFYMQLMRNMETITGVHDVTQGRRPGQVTAASAIAMLQEAGQARIRDKARNLEDMIRRVGRLMVSRILQFYTPGRVIRIRGQAGELEFLQWDPTQVHHGLDFHVEAGSSLQMNEQLRYQLALELFQAGAIDVQGLLEVSNFPQRDEIIQRMQQQQAMQMMMMMQQAGGAPMPGAPPGAPGM